MVSAQTTRKIISNDNRYYAYYSKINIIEFIRGGLSSTINDIVM